jgi:hypothetical protein
MTGDDDVWEGIEFEVHEPTDTIQVPFVDHLFANSDGYQSDALSEYNDELQPKENYLTVSVPEQWISVMNSPAVSVLSVDLNSPVIPYDNVDQFTTQDPTLDPNDLSNYTFDDFLAYQSWYQPDPSDLSQFGETSQQSFPSSQIPADGLGIFNTNVEGISNQDSSQFDLESLNFKATMDQSQFLFKGEPKSPNQSDRSLEFEKTRGQNILPDGRFWNMIKSNGSVLFGCPWEGCQKSTLM